VVKARLGISAVLVALAVSACAGLIGLDSVSYDDSLVEAGEGGPTEGGNVEAAIEACTGTPCGNRCCRAGGTCVDGGACTNDVVDVAAGGNGACAVLGDGTVWCWGENTVGAVGVGSAGDDTCTFISNGQSIPDPCRFRATKVPGLAGATAVGAGFQLACAVQGTDATVWCWGRNQAGVLGHDPASDPTCSNASELLPDGGPKPTPCSATPQQVPGVAGVVELTVANAHACARTSKGEVFCWGANGNGQLGNPDAGASSFTAVPVVGLPTVVQVGVSLFAQSTCAASADGRAWCWGANIPLQPSSPAPRVVTSDGGASAPPVDNVTAVRSGINHVCALRKDGSVVCFGQNDNANLGRGGCDLDGGHPPETVIGLPVVRALDNRWLHTCALDATGKVWCWGVAQDGALGLGNITGSGKCGSLTSSGTATAVPNLPPITRISTGIETTFAIAEDGRLWAWGANDLARVGHPPRTEGDFVNCGDPGNTTTCNPSPRLVQGLP
jgi:hypothetical protein